MPKYAGALQRETASDLSQTLTFQKYFPTFYHSYKQNLQTIQALSEQLQKANTDKENLQSENEQLKAEIASIKEQPEN